MLEQDAIFHKRPNTGLEGVRQCAQARRTPQLSYLFIHQIHRLSNGSYYYAVEELGVFGRDTSECALVLVLFRIRQPVCLYILPGTVFVPREWIP